MFAIDMLWNSHKSCCLDKIIQNILYAKSQIKSINCIKILLFLVLFLCKLKFSLFFLQTDLVTLFYSS